jgi:micrococcal nuclease
VRRLRRERRGKFNLFISLGTPLHFVYLYQFCVCKEDSMTDPIQLAPKPQLHRIHILWTLFTMIAFVSGMLVGARIMQSRIPETETEDASLALCTRVVDGDTIEVMWNGIEERVRMLGIDAPETRRTRSLRAQAEILNMDTEFLLQYGAVATQIVERWILNRNVRLVFPNNEVQRDAFGRLLCYVEFNDTDIGERLLLGGNAITYEATHPREETYRLFQLESQNQRRGIWRNL